MKIIITESQLIKLALKRRLDELSKHIRNSYDWLNPKAFQTFDEFLERVIKNAAGQFISEEMNVIEYDSFQYLRTTIEPIVRNLVVDKYYKEIFDYYNS